MNRTTECGTRRAAIAVFVLLPLLAAAAAGAGEIIIDVAPATLNLASHGVVVTVHTDVPYPDVDVVSVYLAGVAIESWKADDRGDFVAKFAMDDVKAIDGLVVNGTNIFQLVGMTIYGEPFWGEQEVMVIDRGASSPDRHSPAAD